MFNQVLQEMFGMKARFWHTLLARASCIAPVSPVHSVSAGSYWNIEDEGGQRFIQITLVKRVMGFDSFEQLLDADKVDTSITNRVRH
jgi:hypothetical protein